jgi:intraflagellar transport protein 46
MDDVGLQGAALSAEMRDLFQFIEGYKPEKVKLEQKLQCFIPDFIPAVGDIDPMLKVCVDKTVPRI